MSSQFPWWKLDYAYIKERIADLFMIRGNISVASEYYTEFHQIADELVQNYPQQSEYLSAFVQSEQRMGDVLLAMNNIDPATTQYRSYRKDAALLKKLDPANFRFQDFYTTSYQRLGDVQLQKHEYDLALDEFVLYLEMSEQLSLAFPSDNTATYDVANAHIKVGDALFGRRDFSGALDEYTIAEALAKELNDKKCRSGTWQKLLATAHQRRAFLLLAQDKTADAKHDLMTCASMSVKEAVWSPANLSPTDPASDCREELGQLAHLTNK